MEARVLRIFIGLAAVWLFAGGFGSAASSACDNAHSPQRDCKPCKRPDGTLNHSPNVKDLVLDKIQLRIKDLPAGIPPPDDAGKSPDMIINVATNAEDAENDVLDYYYTISGGRIVGTGSSVQWDLNDVPPGTYTITAKVDDSCGICGKTITKGVMIIGKMPVVAATPKPAPATPPTAAKAASTPSNTVTSPAPTKTATGSATPASTSSSVRARTSTSAPTSTKASAANTGTTSASVPCSCPKIIISDPEKSDSDLIFTTKIFDLATTNRLSYIWTVTGGTVVSQDGRTIRLKPSVLGGSVSVTVNGLPPKCDCPTAAQIKF